MGPSDDDESALFYFEEVNTVSGLNAKS